MKKTPRSLPARGVWIEIELRNVSPCRSSMSLPARGVWIEMSKAADALGISVKSLPARGVWIEIPRRPRHTDLEAGHSPQGECGLKYPERATILLREESLPARGVWIEITKQALDSLGTSVTPRKGSVN